MSFKNIRENCYYEMRAYDLFMNFLRTQEFRDHDEEVIDHIKGCLGCKQLLREIIEDCKKNFTNESQEVLEEVLDRCDILVHVFCSFDEICGEFWDEKRFGSVEDYKKRAAEPMSLKKEFPHKTFLGMQGTKSDQWNTKKRTIEDNEKEEDMESLPTYESKEEIEYASDYVALASSGEEDVHECLIKRREKAFFYPRPKGKMIIGIRHPKEDKYIQFLQIKTDEECEIVYDRDVYKTIKKYFKRKDEYLWETIREEVE